MNIFDLMVKRKIPKEVASFEFKILHITDTPDITFGYIKRIARLIKPDIIIHTGDLVDNIKLELSRSEIGMYEKRVKELLNDLREGNPQEIIICIGNHDDEEIIKKHLLDSESVVDTEVLHYFDHTVCVSHKYQDCVEADILMFGHSYDNPNQLDKSPICLNGLDAIYILDGMTGRIASMPYPKDTDYFRQKKFKLGF